MMLHSTNQEYAPSEPLNDGTTPALLTVFGSAAKIEGTFDIADSVQIECEVVGQLKVGGRLVIGERGSVRADVETADAIIFGQYKGNMVATGSVEITPTGRVVGKIETDSLVISKGGFFNGKTGKLKGAQAERALPSGDRPGREGLRAVIQKSSASLRESDVAEVTEDLPSPSELLPNDLDLEGPPWGDRAEKTYPAPHRDDEGHTEQDHALYPDHAQPPPGPPKRRRGRAAPPKKRKKQTKARHDPGNTAERKESQTEGAAMPAFMIEDAGEPLPPLPSPSELLPDDRDLEGPPWGDRPEREDLSRAQAVPQSGRRERIETDHDHGPTAKRKESQTERGTMPAFMIEDASESLPPLPSRSELLPDDRDLEDRPPPEGRAGLGDLDAGRQQSSGSLFRKEDVPDDDRGTGRVAGWQKQPAPFPDDDPLGIR